MKCVNHEISSSWAFFKKLLQALHSEYHIHIHTSHFSKIVVSVIQLLNQKKDVKMLDLTSIPRISTHFYKIAHLQLVTCTVYAAKEASLDQQLLELELQIRDRFPRILLTYYSRCLYHFKFDHIRSVNVPGVPSSNDRLDDLYPQLTYKAETSTSALVLSKPSKGLNVHPTNKSDGQSQDDHQAYISLTFFKSVKKMIVYNLSLQSDMRVFGNYVVSRLDNNYHQFVVVQVDPVVLENGDLVVSYFQMNRLALWDSSVVNFDRPFPEIAKSFVIYVMPSGLRCHFFDTSDYDQTFTRAFPKSGLKLLQLLKLSTGIDLTNKEDILWTKLVPNLQHLNNQTSNISRFVHEVDNKKFIMWPWELCLLQFGSENVPAPVFDDQKSFVDPLEIIDKLIDSNIAANEEHSRTRYDLSLSGMQNAFSGGQTQAFNIPSTISPGKSTGNATTAEDFSIKFETPLGVEVDEQRMQPIPFEAFEEHSASLNEPLEIIAYDEQQLLELHEANLHSEEEKKHDIAEKEEDDDLFGESSDSEAYNTKSEPATIDDKDKGVRDDASKNLKLHEEPLELLAEESHTKTLDEKLRIAQADDNSNDAISPSFVNITKDQMISNWGSNPTSYEDPGAPLPIMPTPVIPQGPSFHSSLSDSNGPLRPMLTRLFQSSKQERLDDLKPNGERLGFVFSPIKFNPVIKSSIDTKYGKGGKFYVANDQPGELDSRARRVRETSVSSGSPLQFSRDTEIAMNPDHASERFDQIGDNQVSSAPESNGATAHDISEHKGGEGMDDEDDEDDDDEEEGDIDDDEESDVDEDLDDRDLKTSPLRLNTIGQDPFGIRLSSGLDSVAVSSVQRSSDIPQFAGLHSPNFDNMRSGETKAESPFGVFLRNETKILSLSPASMNQYDLKDVLGVIPNETKDVDMSLPTTTAASPSTVSSSNIGESSNCLPLILRSINVLTIPPDFILDKPRIHWEVSTILTGFDIDAVEDFEDLDNENSNELFVKGKYLDHYLKWVTTNIVFDFGNFESRSLTRAKLPETLNCHPANELVESEPFENVRSSFESVFPLSFRMSLDEFQFGFTKDADEKDVNQTKIDNHLEFLEEKDSTSMDTDRVTDHGTIFWDSIYHELSTNRENSNSYLELLREAELKWAHRKGDAEASIALNDVKAKVLNHSSEIINFDFLGLRFWRYLDLKPVNSEKNFQVLVLSETSPDVKDLNVFEGGSLSFLNSLRNNYKDNHFGDMKRLSLQTPENRPDLEGVNNGLALSSCPRNEKTHNFYRKVNKTLNSLAELIKFDLINKHNRFDFDRPLLLLFISFDDSIGSISQISKLCRNFEVTLSSHQLSLVQIFSHVIPWRAIIKQEGHCRRLKYLSNTKLTDLSTVLYNKCPDNKSGVSLQKGIDTTQLFTRLIKERPDSLNFKVANRTLNNTVGFSLTNDLFLHVAYDRSIDKRWICASWSDPHGVVTKTKAWHSASKKGESSCARDIGSIIGEIWEISISLLKHLNDDESRRACGTGGKKFLVFTRINSILPDDELVYWKRLTSKYKEISLIVLSANRLPKTTFTLQDTASSDTAISEQSSMNTGGSTNTKGYSMSGMNGVDLLKAFNGVSGTFTTSPNIADINTMNSPTGGVTFHSPRQFFNAQTNFLSPQDGSLSLQHLEGADDVNSYLCDRSLDMIGFIPQTSLPSSNSPTRLGMKTGYLIAEADNNDQESMKNLMIYEVSLLSCSTQLNLNSIMRSLLNQFKKLIYLNYVVGVLSLANTSKSEQGHNPLKRKLRSIVPWHINAVGKTLDYLVHIDVNDSS